MLALPGIAGRMPVHDKFDNGTFEFNKNRGQATPAPDIAKWLIIHEITCCRHFTQQLPAVQQHSCAGSTAHKPFSTGDPQRGIDPQQQGMPGNIPARTATAASSPRPNRAEIEGIRESIEVILLRCDATFRRAPITLLTKRPIRSKPI